MCHLICDISIKYEIWDRLKKTFNMKERIRILIHAIFKEPDLIGKTFHLTACKADRLPGVTRTEFTLEERATIRSMISFSK